MAIEDLNVAGMVKNRYLSRAISDCGFYEFRRQLEYKAVLFGIRIVVADRFYPSSKTCSQCGVVKDELPLGERTFNCESCGYVEDRDVNAAKNLEKLAVGSTVTACGEESSGRQPVLVATKLSSVKQEPSNTDAVGLGV